MSKCYIRPIRGACVSDIRGTRGVSVAFSFRWSAQAFVFGVVSPSSLPPPVSPPLVPLGLVEARSVGAGAIIEGFDMLWRRSGARPHGERVLLPTTTSTAGVPTPRPCSEPGPVEPRWPHDGPQPPSPCMTSQLVYVHSSKECVDGVGGAAAHVITVGDTS